MINANIFPALILLSLNQLALCLGQSQISFPKYSAEEDKVVVELFEGLRVADVSDAMDIVGLQDVGLMDAAIHPAWNSVTDFSHQIRGIALTVRYVPTNKRGREPSPDKVKEWQGNWYQTLTAERFAPLIRQGSVIVIEAPGDTDAGVIGSFNTMVWKSKGALGVITSGGARDTDEIQRQRIPLYFRGPSRGYPPGRTELESVNHPITCGGVLVRPGDVLVADGDGVIVVPREHAMAVAKEAIAILDSDKKARRKMYQELSIPLDETVEP
jgi:regulator of RNase E activity RraA